MPRYEYQCLTCGVTFEATHKMSDPALTTCTCGKDGQVQRLLSAGSGLIFKGSGFYITDYKNANASASSTTAKTAEGSSPAPASAPATESSTSSAPATPAAGSGPSTSTTSKD